MIRPFCNAVTVIESPVDEQELASGIVLPINHSDKPDIFRGVVVASGSCHCQDWEKIHNGVVIYYIKSMQLPEDLKLVFHDDILAYEEEG